MKNFFITITLVSGLFCSLYAQRPITSFKAESIYSFNPPFILDSVSNTGKKFTVSSFLQSPLKPKDIESLKEEKTTNGILTLSKEVKMYSIQKLYFTINNYTYKEEKINIQTNAMFKLSIDGVEEKEKLSSEQDMDSSSNIVITKTLEPGLHWIGISLLCDKKDVIYKIKVTVGDSSNEDSNIIESLSGLTLKTMLCGENPYNISMSNSGDYYLIKYYNTDLKGETTYRIEVRRTRDGIIVFKDNKTIAYSWLPKDNLLYYRDKNDIYTLDPESKEHKLLMTDVPQGDIEFLPSKKDFILSTITKNDNTNKMKTI